MNQNITITIQQRNALVEEYLWCIDAVMRRNQRLLRQARLDREDVYQELAMGLIQAVEQQMAQRALAEELITEQLEGELRRLEKEQLRRRIVERRMARNILNLRLPLDELFLELDIA